MAVAEQTQALDLQLDRGRDFSDTGVLGCYITLEAVASTGRLSIGVFSLEGKQKGVNYIRESVYVSVYRVS